MSVTVLFIFEPAEKIHFHIRGEVVLNILYGTLSHALTDDETELFRSFVVNLSDDPKAPDNLATKHPASRMTELLLRILSRLKSKPAHSPDEIQLLAGLQEIQSQFEELKTPNQMFYIGIV
jgi:hypothetical protein